MQELKLYVPTYNGAAFPQAVKSGEMSEFGNPHVPVIIRRADGVRIVLGSHDYLAAEKPEIQIERRPNGWIIFLHPMGGDDPSGHIYFLDDGRSFLIPQRDFGTTPPIKAFEWDRVVSEVDHANSK